jgi:hypothetical protein
MFHVSEVDMLRYLLSFLNAGFIVGGAKGGIKVFFFFFLKKIFFTSYHKYLQM